MRHNCFAGCLRSKQPEKPINRQPENGIARFSGCFAFIGVAVAGAVNGARCAPYARKQSPVSGCLVREKQPEKTRRRMNFRRRVCPWLLGLRPAGCRIRGGAGFRAGRCRVRRAGHRRRRGCRRARRSRT